MTALSPGQSPPPVSTPILAMAMILCAASSPRSGYRGERFGDRCGTSDVVPLGVVDAELAHRLQRVGVGHELRQGWRSQASGDGDDRLDDEPVGGVVAQAADELAVDLEQVEAEVLEVGERREARAEVVERQATAQATQRLGQRAGAL